jgi:hypothetical protein
MAAAWITEECAPVMFRAHYLRSSMIGKSRLADRGVTGGEAVLDRQGSRLVEVYDYEDALTPA